MTDRHIKTYERLTPREKHIVEKMHAMLEFIAKGDALVTLEGRVGHAQQVVGWAEGEAKAILELLGEQP